MNFSRTFPKALLVLLLVFGFLFLGAVPVQAFCTDILGCLGDIGQSILDPLHAVNLISENLFGVHIPTISDLLGGAIGGIAGSIVKAFAAIVISFVIVMTKLWLVFAGYLIEYAIEFNSNIGEIAAGGYKIVLGLANIGFIVALVVIAFGTMFRSDAFGYKKALPKLIIAALLINFSFFIITKVFVDPVDQITKSINSATDLNVGVLTQLWSDDIYSGFASWDKFTNLSGAAGGLAGDIAKSLASVLAAYVFAFIAVIALFAFAIMLFIRGLALILLIILAPLAWAGLVFPNLKIPGGGNPWTIWWENFTRWLLFAPFAMFFFWLSIGLVNSGYLFATVEDSLTNSVGGMIAAAGLMLGGLYVSNKMGITGAGIALGAVAAGRAWAQLKGADLFSKGYHRLTQPAFATSKDRQRMRNIMSYGQDKRFFGRLLTAPVRGAGRGFTKSVARAERRTQEAERRKFADLIKAPYRGADIRESLPPNSLSRMVLSHMMVEIGNDWEFTKDDPSEEGFIKDLARWEKLGLFEKRGMMKFKLDLADRGMNPERIAPYLDLEEAGKARETAVARGAKVGSPEIKRLDKTIRELKETIKNLRDENLHIMSRSDIAKIPKRLLSETGQYKSFPTAWMEGTGIFEGVGFRDGLIEGLAVDRPGDVNAARSGLRGRDIIKFNSEVAEAISRLEDKLFALLGDRDKRVTVEIDRADGKGKVLFRAAKPEDKALWVQNNWSGVTTHWKDEIIDKMVDLEADEKARERAKVDALRKEDFGTARMTQYTQATKGFSFFLGGGGPVA